MHLKVFMCRVEVWPCAVGARGGGWAELPPPGLAAVASTGKLQSRGGCWPRTLCLCVLDHGVTVHPPSRVTEFPTHQNPAPNPSTSDQAIHEWKPPGALVVHEECQSTGRGETQ